MINTTPLNIYKLLSRLIFLALISAGLKGAAQCSTVQPSFTISTTEICTSSKLNNVTITNTTTGSAANTAIYEWYIFDPAQPPAVQTTWLKNPGTVALQDDGEAYIILVVHDLFTNCYDTAKTRLAITEQPNANFTFNNNNKCKDTDITFTNSSAKVYPFTTYLWDFGDGTTSTLKDPVHSYNAAGNYDVTVTTINGPSCKRTSSVKTVVVIPAPTANFTFTNNQCANNAIAFTNSSTDITGSSTYSWDFGDGGTESQQNPTHTYTASGTYNVELTVSNGVGCDNTISSVITIVDPPTSGFTFTNDNQCAGTVISFTNTASGTTGTTTYLWDFGDGNTSALDNPTHTYATADTYTVSLTVSNGTNCKTVSSPSIVTVTSSPVASFTFTNDNQCAGTILAFTSTSTGTTGSSTYEWDFGDGTISNLINPTHTYSTDGTFNVKLTVRNGTSCMNASLPSTVTVKTTPVSTFTYTAASCTSNSVTFTNTSNVTGTAGTYLWNFGDGNTSPQENPVHVYATNGTYDVTLTVTSSSGCGHTSAISKITIGNLPPVLSFTMSPLTGCSPRTVAFTNTSTGAVPASNYDWDFGNGNALTGVKDPPTQLYHAGTYTIRLISGNACGIDTLYKTLHVDTLPRAIITAPLKGCLPIDFVATNNSTGNNLKYQWFVNGVLTDTTEIISNKTFTTVSNTVQLKVSNSCGTDDTTLTITASQAVKTVISPLKSTICSASDFSFTYTQTSVGDSLSYFWDFDNGNTSTLPNPPAQTFINGATYHPTLIVTGACGKDTSIATLQVYQIPVAPTVADTTICVGTSVTLTATAPGEKYEWFDVPGGTLLKVGASFKTPVLNVNTTYYVQSTILDCTGPLKAVTVKVKPLPVAPTVTNDTICVGENAVLTATGAIGAGFEWFSALTGGTRLDSAVTYNTPVLSATTNYYVQAVMNGCASPRTKTTVQVYPIPAAPTALPVGICIGNTATLTATAPAGTYRWYTAITGGTLLHTGAAYTTPVLTTDTAFYVESESAMGCTGPRKQVKVTVSAAPVADIVANVYTGCAGMEVKFTNNSTIGGVYTWSFATGVPATSTQYAPMPVKFNTPGNHLVFVKVDIAGCTRNDSVYINVGKIPKSSFTIAPAEGCSPVNVTFTNTSTALPGDSYLWNFDDGQTFTSANPPGRIYTATGMDSTYTIKLKITTPNGCKDSSTQKVIVHSNPIASFKPNVNIACMKENVEFTSESIGAINWNWYFGDGATSTVKQPTHQYTTAGTYTVKLVITGAFGCKDSISHDVIINPNPVPLYTATTMCNLFPTQFTDNSTGAIKWEWDFGDASPVDNTISPLHIFPASGSYDVKLTVTNTFGCKDSLTKKITVLERPKADFSFNKSCAKELINFKDTSISADPVSWNWDFGDGSTSISQNTSHIYPIGGLYPVTLIVKNSLGCSDTIVKPVKVGTIPVPLFKANLTCLGKVTSFQDLSTDVVQINKWFYDFDDGNNSVSQNPNYIYSDPGTYNVSLTVTNIDGCDSTYTWPVIVDEIPKVNYTTDTICVNNPTTFTDISVGAVIRWEWDFGDGAKDTIGPIITHTYALAGSYLTSLKIYTAGGCSDEQFKMVIVRNDVKAAMTVKDSACIDELIIMTDNSTSPGAIASSTWNFGDGSPEVTATNTSHAYKTAGIFVVTHTVIGTGGCQNQVTDTVFVNAAPKADFVSANTCINQAGSFTDKSTGSPASWNWDFNDGNTSTEQNPKHTFMKSGFFNVKLSVQSSLGCIDTITKRITVYVNPIAAFTSNTACWGDTTNFLNTSNPMDGSIIKTWWDFDDGTTSNILDPNHVFVIKKDSFIVKMAIVTSYGCIDTVVQTIKTHPIPVFKYWADATSGCNPLTTMFHDTSTVKGGTIVNWLWNFGDKSLTYQNSPVHTYTQEGKFFVSLTLTSSYGCRMTDTLKYPIIVYPKPVAEFTAEPVETSMYEPVIKLKDESQKATMWSWDLGDLTTSTDQNLTHTYADTGTFIVTQVAINEFGCRDTAQHEVRIKAEPTIFIPNAFTPDGNGVNDVFIPKMFGVKEFNMTIYDRWGNLIFTSTDKEIGWNGKVNNTGELVGDGTYIYSIYIRNLLGNPRTYRGIITVIKKTDRTQ